MKPGIVLTDETREIIGAYLAKQRKRMEKRLAQRQEKVKDKEWFDAYLRKE